MTNQIAVSNVIRGIASISGVIALLAVIWALPTWVAATDKELETCSKKIEKLEHSAAAIQDLKVTAEVTKTNVKNLNDDVKDIKQQLIRMSEKQDDLMRVILQNNEVNDHED